MPEVQPPSHADLIELGAVQILAPRSDFLAVLSASGLVSDAVQMLILHGN